MSTRCKFTCTSITEVSLGFNYEFAPVTCGSEENDKFFHYTPYGSLSFGTTEERKFEVDKDYYLDITLAG